MTRDQASWSGGIRAGGIFRIFRQHPGGLTKAEVAQLSGLSRTAVIQRIEPLLSAGLLVPHLNESRARGRPADRFIASAGKRVFLVTDMGASGLRAAACDAFCRILAQRSERSDITDGPNAVLARVDRIFDELLLEIDRSPEDVGGIGVDVPGPVDHESGRVITPPIMAGWHDFDIPGHFGNRYRCPVIVEKDVNAMAFGEHQLVHSAIDNLVFVKVGTGIGTGTIIGGEIYRGSDGAAGDVGHIQIEDREFDPRPTCRCGRIGCVEAHAGGWALLRDLREMQVDVNSVSDLVRITREGHVEANRLYRRAARIIGTAISDLINVLNPRAIVIGGQLAGIDDLLFATVREVVYGRSLPLATRNLQILPSRLGDAVGVHGLARLVLDEVYSARRVEDLLNGSVDEAIDAA